MADILLGTASGQPQTLRLKHYYAAQQSRAEAMAGAP